MQTFNELETKEAQFYRFQVFLAAENIEGKLEKTKTVGMAYLKSGQDIYTIRLWTFIGERFYLVAKRQEPEKFFVMVREANRSPGSKNKYFWNIVGNANADTKNGVMVIEFDLLDKPVYMNLFPEKFSQSSSLPEAGMFDTAA